MNHIYDLESEINNLRDEIAEIEDDPLTVLPYIEDEDIDVFGREFSAIKILQAMDDTYLYHYCDRESETILEDKRSQLDDLQNDLKEAVKDELDYLINCPAALEDLADELRELSQIAYDCLGEDVMSEMVEYFSDDLSQEQQDFLFSIEPVRNEN